MACFQGERRMSERNMDLESDIANVYTDDDEVNGAKEEYEGWKVREFARIRRDREATVRENEERERVKNMTDEERRKKPNQAADQNKFRFIRKYYHKGAFFHNDAAAADIKLH